ncbi:D-alanyl-D-alanine carboxypeptidase/D-alanyl-D-alanine endopeptidase [Pseudarthrobacter sp. N5]|uniref:D-alanyl-D-alanine carboxypeptidase/D-alanyl-D-alanine endopeptidase n=1 Tax=Pseudarthrobacter sp. N5 TaxID=3418416 RepID=UPI003CFB79FC
MKSTIRSASNHRVVRTLKRTSPLALLTVVLLVLAVPSGMVISSAFTAPDQSLRAAASVPAWQQLPSEMSRPQGISPLLDSAPIPSPDKVAAHLESTLKTDGGGAFTALVKDAVTGQVLFDRGGSDSRIPASNMKLLTAVAALRSMGSETRFSTRVLAGQAPASVVLAGGGDVLLGAGESAPDQVVGRAGLATLARLTVQSLKENGVTGAVSVQLDDSLFTGPALNPAWSLEDVAAGETAPLYPLALNSARYDPLKTTGPRPQDSAITTAEAFAAELKTAGAASGLTVAPGVGRSGSEAAASGGPATGSGGDAGPEVLAEVQSATVSQQVDLMLQTSDNYLAEALGRMSAHADGLPAGNDGATATVMKQLTGLGVNVDTMRLADVSGLALGNRVSARQFAEVVRAITSGPDPRLRNALAGFPVAGLTGTLDDRYGDDSTAGGAGLVRAKTGTLNSVIALSGYVVDAEGRLLVFSFIGNGLMPGAAGNKAALDRSASALASCGCR